MEGVYKFFRIHPRLRLAMGLGMLPLYVLVGVYHGVALAIDEYTDELRAAKKACK